MPFNAETYRMNKWRREALAKLNDARLSRARARAGVAYGWEVDRIPRLVQQARIGWRLYLSQRRIVRASAEQRRIRAGGPLTWR
jgi:hypothetical protein